MDKFERHLKRQSLNGPPTEWRAEILETARQSRTGILPVTDRVAENDLAQKSDATVAAGNDFSPRKDRSRFQRLKPGWLRRVTGWKPVLRGWLWPHPGAWATLATVWILIFALHHQVQTEIAQEVEMAGYRGDPARMLAALEEQRKAVDVFLATGGFQLAVADRPKRIRSRDSAPPLMLFTS